MHGWDDVAIGIKSQDDGGMPEHLRDELDGHAFGEQDRRRCVAHVVEADGWQSRRDASSLKPLRLIRGAERFAHSIAEHQVAFGPTIPLGPAVECLLVFMDAKRGDTFLSKVNAAGSSGSNCRALYLTCT